MKAKMTGLMVTMLGGSLLVYSGLRSLDFIQMTLPEDKKLLALFGLAALDLGLILWLLHFLYSARGGWQRGIALGMVVIDFLGAVALFTLDTLYRSGEAGIIAQLTPEEIRAAVLALSGVIALNVAATVANHLTDPVTRRAMAAEEAEDRIEELTLKTIREDAPVLAAKLAPALASSYLNKLSGRYAALLAQGGDILEGEAVDPEPVTTWRKPKREPMVYNAEEAEPFLSSKNGRGE